MTDIVLSDIAAGTGGFVINGRHAGEKSGYSVAAAGDVNGDGFADVIIGAYASDAAAGTDAGRSFVVFGKTGSGAVDLSAIAAGDGGFAINGQAAGDFSGWSVSAAGDVNGDGLSDLIVGVPFADPLAGVNAGRSYIVFGKTGTAAIELSAIAAGNGGFVIDGQSAGDRSGFRVDAAGDVNGDHLSDLIVGAPTADSAGGIDAGRSYVVFGKTGTAPTALSAVAAGNGGFVIGGACAGDQSGFAVSSAGDVNGDGLGDLLVGANLGDPASGIDAGRSYVVFGKSGTGAVELAAVAAGSGGFVIDGQAAGDGSGRSVAAGGDVNGDGLADLLIGAPLGDPAGGIDAGRSYVVFGKAGGVAVELSAIAAGDGGFVINGQTAGDLSGYSLTAAGDVNGDGLSDLIVGAPASDPAAGVSAGRSYIVFGRAATTAVDLSAIAAGDGGFVIDGQAPFDYSGQNVAAAGDVNGDGLSDLIVGSAYSDPAAGVNAGRSYVIFGSTGGAFGQTAVDQFGSTGNDTLVGSVASETIIADAGDDTLIGNGGADVLHGGAGDDSFVLNAGNIAALSAGVTAGQLARVDGGSGIDSLVLVGSGVHLDLTAIANPGGSSSGSQSRIESIERIDLTGSGNNSLTLAVKDVLDITGMNNFNNANGWADGSYDLASGGGNGANPEMRHQLVVDGNPGDTLNFSDAADWIYVGTVTNGGNTYSVFNHATEAAQVLVDDDVLDVADPGRVRIAGTAVVGGTVTAVASDGDGLGTVAYQWLLDGVAVDGATTASLLLGADDLGKAITVTASYTDGHGTPESVTSAALHFNAVPTGSVTIAGIAAEDQTLTAANTLADLDGLGAIGYQWQANGSDIAGATAATLLLGQAQVGATISVRAGYSDGHGTLETVASAATGVVANVNDAPLGADRHGQVVENSTTVFRAADFAFVDEDAGAALGSITLASVFGRGLLSFDGVAAASGDVISVARLGALQFKPAEFDFGSNYAGFSFRLDDGSGAANSASLAAYTLTLDVAMDREAANRVFGTAGNDRLESFGGDDTIVGLAGNDRLDGGAGADTMTGGSGDDTYVVDSLADRLVELADGGTDNVEAAIDYVLAGRLENLALSGAGNLEGSGNAAANILLGNAGNNRLDGRAGADRMIGGGGDDSYRVDSAGDSVEEAAAAGTDDVVTGLAAYTLPANVDNLRYGGSGNFSGVGNELANRFTGGAGDDRFDGGAGSDTVVLAGRRDEVALAIDFAADGNMLAVLVAGAEGSDELRRIDRIAFADQTLTLFGLYGDTARLAPGSSGRQGGAGNERFDADERSSAVSLAGAGGDDRLGGGGGADLLDGGDGNDALVGGAGNDNLSGGSGADHLRGGDGRDRLSGGDGSDYLDGGSGGDSLEGGAGNDSYVLDSAADRVVERADEGLDTIRAGFSLNLAGNLENLVLTGSGRFDGGGNRHDNRIAGNAGDNILNGQGGADTLIGNDGDDRLQGGAGDDILDGGAGSDRLFGGPGHDTARFAGRRSDYSVSLAVGDIVRVRAGDGSTDQLVGIEQASFDDGNYLIRGADGRILLAGADALLANTATYGDDVLSGSDEDDGIDGGDGNDRILGLDGSDTLLGGRGNDSLDGGSGADRMSGGAGNDSYFVDSLLDQISEADAAGRNSGGSDTVVTTLAAWTLADDLERLQSVGTLAFSGVGNRLANTLVGGDGDDSLDGGLGADRLLGGAGNDTYVIDHGGDRIDDSGGSADRVVSRLAAWTLAAGIEQLDYAPLAATGNFTGIGNAGANRIGGGDGNDRLIGLAGDDTLSGGAGNDVLRGGDGDDRLDGGSGVDRLDGGLGDDTVLLAGSLADYTVALLPGRLLTLSANGVTDTLIDIEHVVFDQGTLATADDTSIAIDANGPGTGVAAGLLFNRPGFLADVLVGSAGGDNIDGLAGNDSIAGLAGDDTLLGGAGNDSLNGGAGHDVLRGGGGSDRFVFDAPLLAGNSDRIGDFGAGDRILLDHDVFVGLAVGALDRAAFHAGAVAAAADDRLIYDRAGGDLYYDADGNGDGAAVLLATLGATTHPALTAASFGVIG